MIIRDIDSSSENEIKIVASRMGQTLVEVLGPEKGKNYYSDEWLVDRLKWHLDRKNCHAKVAVMISVDNEIIGHAIARLEKDEQQSHFGYFSTIYVSPKSRKQGLALRLIEHIEQWLMANDMKKIVYNTAENHHRLISIFEKRGYQITHREDQMVQLTRIL